MEEEQLNHLKGAVEALLFVSEKPVTLDQLKEAIQGAKVPEIREVLTLLKKDYEATGRGVSVIEIAGGWQMLSSAHCAGYIREFYKTRHKEKLSRPALETLAIIAYKQPVSRTDVEVVRGVNSDGIVMHLLNKGLIKIAGRKEVPGRPYVYGTTAQFLEYFGLRSLEDLPKLEEFPMLMAGANEQRPTPNEQGGELAPTSADANIPLASGDRDNVSEGKDSSADASAEKTLDTKEEASLKGGVEFSTEELARERMRMDIDELECKPDVPAGFMADDIPGEASGQARFLSHAAAEESATSDLPPGEENAHPRDEPEETSGG